jgi:hypothetical protein
VLRMQTVENSSGIICKAVLSSMISLVGCDQPILTGRFIPGRTGSLATSSGEFVEVWGTEPNFLQPERPLIRLLVISQSGSLDDTAFVYDHIGCKSNLSFTDRLGRVVLKVDWDRERDCVEICNTLFDRSIGYAFVSIEDGDSWKVYQSNLPDCQSNSKDAELAFKKTFALTVPSIEDVTFSEIEY